MTVIDNLETLYAGPFRVPAGQTYTLVGDLAVPGTGNTVALVTLDDPAPASVDVTFGTASGSISTGAQSVALTAAQGSSSAVTLTAPAAYPVSGELSVRSYRPPYPGLVPKSLGGAGVETLGGTLATLDSKGNQRNVLDDGSGMSVAGIISTEPPITTVAGTTGGSYSWMMPFQGANGYKKVLVYFDNYENDTTVSQTITFPVPFLHDNPIFHNYAQVVNTNANATELTFDPDATTTYNGWVVVEGF